MKLHHLTDKTLLLEMISLAQRERALLTDVLWHLKEIDRRKLYSEVKCGSLFQYCVKVLKYSEGAASRRVSACRLLKEMPELSQEIKSGEINLTQINQAKNFFHEMGMVEPKEKQKIISEIKGKTIKQTEEILWKKKDQDAPRKVTLKLNQETVDSLTKLKALKAHTFSDYDLLIMNMVETMSKIWDPALVQRKRKEGSGDSRYVQVGIKAQVWEKDKHKCAQCGSTYALQIDHIKPFALGGKTQADNLRLLCRNCNQRKGFEVFGDSYSHSLKNQKNK